MNLRSSLLLITLICSLQFVSAQKNTVNNNVKPPITWQDIADWEFIRPNTITLSSDGKWSAYTEGPTQGDLKLWLKTSFDTTKYAYEIGGAASAIQFNEQASYIAFLESSKYKDIKANEKAKRPSAKKLRIVSLKDTASTTYDNVAGFQFSNENSEWIAIRFDNNPAGPKGPDAAKGSDLLLYNLKTKKSFNIGNVNEFHFNKSGQYLAYTIDANQQNGNGIFLRDMVTGMTYALDNDKATFNKINWNKEGTAFALLKSKKEKDYKNPVYTLIGVKDIAGSNHHIFTYTGLDEHQITSGFGISENSVPYWSKDLNTIFFGIAKIEKSEEKEKAEKNKDEAAKNDSTATKKAEGDSTAIAKNKPNEAAKPNKKDLEKPDMIIWNWKDKRLQSAQKNQLNRDKNYTSLSALDIRTNRFISLADSNIKSVTLAPNQLVGYAYDFTPYEYESNLNGQTYGDLYIVDIPTGNKKLAIEKYYFNAARGMFFSPDSKQLLYYNDGNYHVLSVTSLSSTNITENIATSFIAEKVDNNVTKPGTPSYGWTADGKSVLIRDNYDLWKISPDGKSAVTLTDNWKKQKQLIQRPYYLYPDDDFIDLKKDQYFAVFDDDNKNAGIGYLKSGAQNIQVLLNSSDIYQITQKPKNSNNILYFSKQNSTKSPELFVVTNNDFAKAKQLTSNTPKQEKFAFSSGSKLITYINDFGDTLQATLFLPANYVEGQSYPTITYIYERLTDGTNVYTNPGYPGGGFNRAVYNSNGYAVLMPDISYKLNDPGMSAVACVVPAVKAAINTGIVDAERVGIHGHSWGGYQTSFLITQTNIFKAAVAGAPLTNMISMYSLIYWNSGSTNQSIFESSQGRLTSGYWDNWDAYARNSPIYHIKNVNTPLVILHNDKDGAVDYTQGIEYFNGLRRLSKPVVMLTYNGENHGLVKEVNQKDYAVRMMEFFDYYLKDKTAPDWWEKGVNYIDLADHLEQRAF